MFTSRPLSRAMRRVRLAALIGFSLLAGAPAAIAATYYVDISAPNTKGNGSQSVPFQQFWQAIRVVKPGDIVYVAPGNYPAVWFNIKGQPDKPIMFVGDTTLKNPPKIRDTYSDTQFAVNFHQSAYITFAGFDVMSTKRAGIYMDEGTHHITIARNYAHDSPCSGISSYRGDYIHVIDNVVAYNTMTDASQCNAISLYQLTNFDNAGGFHNLILKNTVYGNVTYAPMANGKTSDGNGIIVDDSRHTQHEYYKTKSAYTGKTLINNNVVFDNGARGIHVYYSDYVQIVNNTVVYNNRDPLSGEYRQGEIDAIESGRVNVYNNIMVSRNLQRHYGLVARWNRGHVTADNNLTFGGTGAYFFEDSPDAGWGSLNARANPMFVKETLDPSQVDLRVRSGSPAWNLGHPSISPTVDVIGTARNTSVGPITAGAYQNTGN